MKKFIFLLFFLLSGPALGQSFSSMPYTFVNGTTFIPSQMSANFSSLVNSGNAVVQNLQLQLNNKGSIPSGALIYFNLASCPGGWTDVEAGQTTLLARHIRGLDNGAGKDTTGTTVGNYESNTIAGHTHILGAYVTGVNTTVQISHSTVDDFIIGFTTTGEGTSGSPTGVTIGANSPEQASLLLCSKN